jgi:hypothetical protein
MIVKQHHFRNSNILVQEVPENIEIDPSFPGGKEIIIIDSDSGDSYHFATNNDVARRVGSQLMGLGQVEIPNGKVISDIADEVRKRQ